MRKVASHRYTQNPKDLSQSKTWSRLIWCVLIISDGSKKPWRRINNVAEYLAVLFGMKSALNLGIESSIVHSGSDLVVLQANGNFKII